MRLYIGDFLADTLDLSRDEIGGYMLLLMHSWQHGPLPDDDRILGKITRSGSGRGWRQLRPRLERFFDVSDGFWRQKRLEKERFVATQNSVSLAAAGRAGVEAKRLKKLKAGQANGSAEDKPGLSSAIDFNLQPSTTSSLETPQGGCSSERVNARAHDPPNGVDHNPGDESKEVTHGRGRQQPEKRQLEDGWSPGPGDCHFAASRGWDDRRISDEAERFRDYNLSRGNARADWAAAWRLWVQRSEAEFREAQQLSGDRQSTPVDAALREYLNRRNAEFDH